MAKQGRVQRPAGGGNGQTVWQQLAPAAQPLASHDLAASTGKEASAHPISLGPQGGRPGPAGQAGLRAGCIGMVLARRLAGRPLGTDLACQATLVPTARKTPFISGIPHCHARGIDGPTGGCQPCFLRMLPLGDARSAHI